MPETTQDRIDTEHYRDALLVALTGASATRLAHLAERAILAAHVITNEFKTRFPAEFAAWESFGEDQS